MVSPLWKNGLVFPQKVKYRVPYDPVLLLLSIYLKELKIGPKISTCACTIHNNQEVERTPPGCSSVDGWINKLWYIHVKKHYSSIERSEVLVHAKCEWKKPDTKGYILYDSIYMNFQNRSISRL